MKNIITFFKRIRWPVVLLISLFAVSLWMLLWTLDKPSFRPEETWVLLTVFRNNISEMVFGENYHPRTTPVGFLFIIRWIGNFIGENTFVLRLPAVFASALTSLIGFLFCIKHLKNSYFGLLFICFWHFHVVVLVLSKDVKPYAFDAFFSIALLYYFMELRKKDALESYKHVCSYAVFSLLAIVVSHPAIFVIFTLSILWLLEGILHKKSLIKTWLPYCLMVGSIYSLYYIFIVSIGASQVPGRDALFSEFMLGEAQVGILSQFLTMLHTIVTYFLKPIFILEKLPSLLIAILFFIGLCSFAKKHKYLSAFFVLLVINAIILSYFGRYPFGGQRTNLYIVPILLIVFIQSISIVTNLRIQRIIISCICLLSIVLAFEKDHELIADTYSKIDVYADYLKRNAKHSDLILGCPPAKNTKMYHRLNNETYVEVGSWDYEHAFIEDAQSVIKTKQPDRYWLFCFTYYKSSVESRSHTKDMPCKLEYQMQDEKDQHAFLQLYDCSNVQ